MARVKLNPLQEKFKDRNWWFETIAANNPEAAIAALQNLGYDLPLEVIHQDIMNAIRQAVASGDSDKLFAALLNSEVDWTNLSGNFIVSFGAYIGQHQQAQTGGNQPLMSQQGGMDWGNMDMWQQLHDAIFQGATQAAGINDKPTGGNTTANNGNEEEDEPKTWQNYIGIGIIGFGILCVLGMIVYAASNHGDKDK